MAHLNERAVIAQLTSLLLLLPKLVFLLCCFSCFVNFSLFYCCKLRTTRWVNYGAQKKKPTTIQIAASNSLAPLSCSTTPLSERSSAQLLLIQLLLSRCCCCYCCFSFLALLLPCGIAPKMIFDQNLMILQSRLATEQAGTAWLLCSGIPLARGTLPPVS